MTAPSRTSEASNRPMAVAGAIGSISNVVFAIAIFLAGPSQAAKTEISDLGNLLVPMLLLPLCFLVRGLSRSERRVPMLLGWSTLWYVVGMVFYVVQHYVWHEDPDVSLADAAWMATYPCLLLAILRWPTRHALGFSRLRVTVDATLVAACLWMFSWVFLLGPTLMQSRESLAGTALTVLYPAGDVIMMAALLEMARKGIRTEFRLATRLLVASGIVVIFADTVYAFLKLHGIYREGDPIDIWWPVSCTLSNLAAYSLILKLRSGVAPEAKPDHPSQVRSQLWSARAPYFIVPPVLALLASMAILEQPDFIERGAYAGAVVVLLALIARQRLIQRENLLLLERLNESYESLRERTEEIERKNAEIEVRNTELTRVSQDLARNNDALTVANSKLAALVTVDGMTGLANHRAFHERLREEVQAAQQFDHPLTLLMADIDHFKWFNDAHGHPAGDEVIRQVAKILFDEIGPKDLAARYGGEEFAILLPYVTAAEARSIAQRLCDQVRARASALQRVTISIGVSEFGPKVGSAEDMVQMADMAMYAAKSQGRDRFVLANEDSVRLLTLESESQTRTYDPSTPLGLAAVLSAGLRNHPRALALEPECLLVSGLLSALELKDGETREHSERVMWFAMRLAQSVLDLGVADLSPFDVHSLAYGALLHDIGKIALSDTILKYPGPLSEAALQEARQHPIRGVELVARFPALAAALPVVRSHHERWDGSGYPDGLKGNEIPAVARVFAIVDALESMAAGRPYRRPMAYSDVEREVARQSGSHFDPILVQAFLCVPPREWTLPESHPAFRNWTPSTLP